MLRVVLEATRARVVRLGSRADRVPQPFGGGDRLQGFRRLREIEIEPAQLASLARAFGSRGSYACADHVAAPLPLAPVQIGFTFESDHGRVDLVLLEPEQVVQMESSDGIFAEAPLSERGAASWHEALRGALEPGVDLEEFYTSMRAPGDTAASAEGPAIDWGWIPSAAANAPERQLETVTRVIADYPDPARKAGVEGTVRLLVLVGPDGRVKAVTVLQSVPLLDQAARDAMFQWRFVPWKENGVLSYAWTVVPMEFRLDPYSD